MLTNKDRMYGMLIGCAVGDSFGMPSEMWSRRRIKDHFGEITDFLDAPDSNEISCGLKAYNTTDDTIITNMVCEMLVDTMGDPSPVELMKRIKRWIADNPKAKAIIGPSTRKAFALIEEGTPVEEAGKSGITNGSAMKIAPVGAVFSFRDLDKLIDRVETVCKPTHNTSAAISGASAIAAAVSYAFEGKSLHEMPYAAKIGAELGSLRGVDVNTASVKERIELACGFSDTCPEDMDFADYLYDVIGTGLPCSESVPSAIAVAYRSGGDIMRAAHICANLGGDTDTIGAMAGAVIGAYCGAGSVDEEVRNKVQSVNGYNFKRTAVKLEDLRAAINK